MDIKCRKLNCKYNDNWVCKAKGIEITSATDCKTYEIDLDNSFSDKFEVKNVGK